MGSKMISLCFSSHSPATPQYQPVLAIKNMVACAWAGDRREAMQNSQEGTSAAAQQSYILGVKLSFE